MRLVLLVSVLICAGQLLQKRAADDWRGRTLTWQTKLASPWLWLAMASLAIGMLFWLIALQSVPVGVAYPMLSLNFVWITLASRFLFAEQTDLRHWLGIVLIIGGVICLAGKL